MALFSTVVNPVASTRGFKKMIYSCTVMTQWLPWKVFTLSSLWLLPLNLFYLFFSVHLRRNEQRRCTFEREFIGYIGRNTAGYNYLATRAKSSVSPKDEKPEKLLFGHRCWITSWGSWSRLGVATGQTSPRCLKPNEIFGKSEVSDHVLGPTDVFIHTLCCVQQKYNFFHYNS